MDIKQAQRIWGELTIIRGRAQATKGRVVRRMPAISRDLWLDTIHRDMTEIEVATERILTILAEMEKEAGIGVAVSSEERNAGDRKNG